MKPPAAIRPSTRPIQSGPFDGMTTFRTDYVPKKGGRIVIISLVEKWFNVYNRDTDIFHSASADF